MTAVIGIFLGLVCIMFVCRIVYLCIQAENDDTASSWERWKIASGGHPDFDRNGRLRKGH